MTSRSASLDDLLDLAPWVGQRQELYRFHVLDRTLARIGTVQPRADAVPSVEVNVHATIKRTLRSFHLSPADAAAINPLTDRIQPVMVLPEVSETEHPLGVFLFAAVSHRRSSRGVELESTLYDQGLILEQPLRYSYGVGRGSLLTGHLQELAEEAGLPAIAIEESARAAGSSAAWTAGRDSRAKAMNAIAGLLGYYSPYFDNAGTLIGRAVPDLASSTPDHQYPGGPTCRILADSIEERDDLLEAANVYVAVSTAAGDTEISGSYEVPDSAPHSVTNRGFEVVQVIDAPGLESSAAAAEMAKARAAQDFTTYRWVEFDAAPDPRHDVFAICSYLDEGNFREQGWKLACRPGGPHRHRLRRVYAD